MAEAVTLRYEDDEENPIATVTALHVQATGIEDIYTPDPTDDDPSNVKMESYYFQVRKGSVEQGRSHFAAPSADGDIFWDGYIIPTDGAHTIRLMKVGDTDTEVASVSVTADAP